MQKDTSHFRAPLLMAIRWIKLVPFSTRYLVLRSRSNDLMLSNLLMTSFLLDVNQEREVAVETKGQTRSIPFALNRSKSFRHV